MLGISQRLLNEQFALDDVAVTPHGFRHSGCLSTVHDVRWNDGVQSGEVVIESARKPDDPSTIWAPVATVTFDNATVAPKVDQVAVPGAYGAFRHRITDPVQGGTVTTSIHGATG